MTQAPSPRTCLVPSVALDAQGRPKSILIKASIRGTPPSNEDPEIIEIAFASSAQAQEILCDLRRQIEEWRDFRPVSSPGSKTWSPYPSPANRNPSSSAYADPLPAFTLGPSAAFTHEFSSSKGGSPSGAGGADPA